MTRLEMTVLLAAAAAAATSLLYAPLGMDAGIALAVAAVAAALAGLRVARNPFRLHMVPAYVVIMAALVLPALGLRPDGAALYLLAGLAALGWGLSTLLAAGFPVPALPPPDGPFAVGATVTELTREADGQAAQARTLRIKVWYPAATGPGTARAGEPLWGEYYDRGMPAGLRLATGYLREARTHTVPDAPIAAAAGDCPLVLYQHGLVSIASENTLLMEMLASHGYIVVSVSHVDQMREYRAIRQGVPAEEHARDRALHARLRSAGTRDERAAVMRELYLQSSGMPVIVRRRSEDTSFVLDHIGAVLERIPAYRGKGRALPVEAAVVGFSLGGAVATEWCRTDPRCGAAVNMDGGLFGSRPLDAVEVPYLMLYSETSEGGNDFLKAVSGGVFEEATLRGARHADFCDATVLWRALKWIGMLGRARGRDVVRSRNDHLRTFLDRHVRHRKRGRKSEKRGQGPFSARRLAMPAAEVEKGP